LIWFDLVINSSNESSDVCSLCLFVAFTAYTTQAISASGAVQLQAWLLRYSCMFPYCQVLAFYQANRQKHLLEVKTTSISQSDCWQVHVRFRRCFREDRSCTCAVVVREDNNILGINACQLGRPPTLIKYLVDQLRPACDIEISEDGLAYVVSDVFRWLFMLLGWEERHWSLRRSQSKNQWRLRALCYWYSAGYGS